MRIEGKATENLTDADRTGWNALRLAAYPPDAPVAPHVMAITWAPTDWHFFVRDDADRIVSHVGTLTRTVLLNGVPVRIGGVGNVHTHPAARGRGYASAAMERAHAWFHDDARVPFALLDCGEHRVSFYAALGWQRFTGAMTIVQPEGVIPYTASPVMVRSIRGEAPTDGDLDLQGPPW